MNQMAKATWPVIVLLLCGWWSVTHKRTNVAVRPILATLTIAADERDGPAAALTASQLASRSGATFYLAPAAMGGRDSNSGLSTGAPWLSPNHSLQCGDVILAAPSASYDSANFISGHWGKVYCPNEKNVAWLKCARFDACKIISNSGPAGMLVDQSYWGVQGWEVTTTAGAVWGGCFLAVPNDRQPQGLHHIIFANNVANGCQASGFASSNRRERASVDYLAIVGNVAYNAAQSNTECYSGISINEPIQSDSAPGTHIYVAGNFSYGNYDPDPCAGGAPFDGEGLIFDTFDGSVSRMSSPYGAQALAENNILIGNGGRGLQVGYNNSGRPPFATIYLRHNTMWGNNRDGHQNVKGCGELNLNRTTSTIARYNLVETSSATGCGNNPIYAISVTQSDSTVQVEQNIAFSPSGTSLKSWRNGAFSYGSTNIVKVDPAFVNPVVPGPPNCGTSSSVPDCMAPMIADFTPKAAQAIGFGYQVPNSAPTYDPLFPQWLCNVNLPRGLVKMGCRA